MNSTQQPHQITFSAILAMNDSCLPEAISMGRYVTSSVNLEMATEIARDYLAKAGYPFARLERAEQDKNRNRWRLTFNLGLQKRLLKHVVIDGNTREVVAFA